jgi:hypothetical protein
MVARGRGNWGNIGNGRQWKGFYVGMAEIATGENVK